jgi:hypothetical protein
LEVKGGMCPPRPLAPPLTSEIWPKVIHGHHIVKQPVTELALVLLNTKYFHHNTHGFSLYVGHGKKELGKEKNLFKEEKKKG